MGIFYIVGGIVALACLIGAFSFLRHKRLIDDLPTSKTLGVFIGLAELKGTAESDKPLTSHLAEIPCVLYRWKVDEHWSRMVTTIGPKGVPTTHHESGWKTVAKDEQITPFYLKDETGIIRIIPQGAEIEDKEVFDKTCKRTDPLYFNKGPRNEIANSDHQRRFHETAITLHTKLYVMGQAREREDIVAAEIAKDKKAPMFLISTRTERQVSSSHGVWFWFWLVLGLLAAVGGVLAGNLVLKTGAAGNWQPYVITAGGFLFILALGWVWMVYNSLVSLRQRVRQGWAQVDIQLKRRNDLIPNLAQAVEGYSTHERDVQELVTKMRQQMSATPPGVHGSDYAGCIPVLRATVERYPDLKAGGLFLKLQKELADTEQRIALSRDYFNEITTFYNTRLEIVPDRFLAKMMRLKPQALMGAADFERAPVKVDLVS
ncbi:MAG: LemA family protein [Dehalococcoidales bacterium]|nr:LemA family protein [Dehalococcoidales bacterium]